MENQFLLYSSKLGFIFLNISFLSETNWAFCTLLFINCCSILCFWCDYLCFFFLLCPKHCGAGDLAEPQTVLSTFWSSWEPTKSHQLWGEGRAGRTQPALSEPHQPPRSRGLSSLSPSEHGGASECTCRQGCFQATPLWGLWVRSWVRRLAGMIWSFADLTSLSSFIFNDSRVFYLRSDLSLHPSFHRPEWWWVHQSKKDVTLPQLINNSNVWAG